MRAKRREELRNYKPYNPTTEDDSADGGNTFAQVETFHSLIENDDDIFSAMTPSRD